MNPLCYYSLLNTYDLFVWDFDDTLIDTRTYRTSNMNPDSILTRTDSALLAEIPGVTFFRDLCIYLVCRGKRVGIASFGTYEIIQAYMDRIFGMGQKVFTRNNIKCIMRDCKGRIVQYMRNKNNFIAEIMDLYRLNDYTRVVLFDDQLINCTDARMIGINAVKIEGHLFDSKTMTYIHSNAPLQCSSNGIALSDPHILRESFNDYIPRETALLYVIILFIITISLAIWLL